MYMVEYLSCFPSATAPETSHYDANFTAAKVRINNEALNHKDKLNPRGHTVNIILKITAVEGIRACVRLRKRLRPNHITRKIEHIKSKRYVRSRTRAWQHTTDNQPITIEIFAT